MRRSSATIGLLIAALAALYRLLLGSSLTNDDFSHLTLSRQFLGGDLPVRDFVDSGITLTWGLSAAAQALFGHRLLAEAIIVASAFLVSVYAVFALVRSLSGSTVAAAAAALLPILAAPRGYAYPKVIVYAVAATLWWQYVRVPSRRSAVALGVWTALAFYWRPDHGVYVAGGVGLAMIAAHGFRRPVIAPALLSGATAFGLVLPYFVFVASLQSIPSYVRDKFSEAQTIHTVIGSHEWPGWPIRRLADVIRLDPPQAFGPRVLLRWSDGTTPDARAAVIARHRLLEVDNDEDHYGTTAVRLAGNDTKAILALLNDPAISDTSGIDRSTAVPRDWPHWEQLRFRHRWLRLRILAGIDSMSAAGDAAATVFYLLPAFAFAAIALVRRRLQISATPRAVLAFCAFAVVVNIGIMRTPYELRTAEGIIMPAILIGWIAGVLLPYAAAGGWLRRMALRGAVAVLVLFAMMAMATVGQFGEHVSWFAGDWRSMARVRGAWSDSVESLVVSPPLRYWDAAPGPVPIRLARYASACVPPADRLAVLWFAPDIYYYADRLMAIRHMVFAPGLASEGEQELTRAKFQRFAPPVVFAPSMFRTDARTVFPGLVDDIERDYVRAGSIDEDEGYLVLVRRDRAATGTWGARSWPCFR